MIKEKPACPVCQGKVIGKNNKDFCDISCKNRYHYISELQIKKIDSITCNKFVRRNYKILLGIMRGNVSQIILHRNVLFEQGFNQFEFLEEVKRKGIVYFQIQEFEFRVLHNGHIEVLCTENQTEFYKEFLERWKIPFPEGFHLDLKKYQDGIFRFFKILKKLSSVNSTVYSFIHGERIEIPNPKT